jgi:hypothetical protein
MEVIQVLSWLLFSAIKFFLAPTAVFLSGYSYFETIAITITGGFIGVLAFFYGGGAFFQWISFRFSSDKPTTKKVFSKKNRVIIQVKRSYGLFGLAFLTPFLLSIPIGTIIAAKYYRDDKRAIPVFFASIIFWSVVLTTMTSSFGPITWSDILPF